MKYILYFTYFSCSSISSRSTIYVRKRWIGYIANDKNLSGYSALLDFLFRTCGESFHGIGMVLAASIPADSITPTFAQAVFNVITLRLAGEPFIMKAGTKYTLRQCYDTSKTSTNGGLARRRQLFQQQRH